MKSFEGLALHLLTIGSMLWFELMSLRLVARLQHNPLGSIRLSLLQLNNIYSLFSNLSNKGIRALWFGTM